MIAAPLHVHAQGAARAPRAAQAAAVKSFDSPKQAADALLAAATAFDVAALHEIFGPKFDEIVLPGKDAEDRQRAAEFVDAAREKAHVSVDPATRSRAFLLVGNSEWPFPIPIVKRGTRWSFDAEAGREEMRAGGSVATSWTRFKSPAATSRRSTHTRIGCARASRSPNTPNASSARPYTGWARMAEV